MGEGDTGGEGTYTNHYDVEQQLTQSTLPSGRTLQGSYNQFGSLEQASYPEATIAVDYEAATRRPTQLTRTSSDGTQTQSLTYTYDGGLVTSMAWSGVANGCYRYRYDHNFHLVGMQLDDCPEIQLERDADGLLTRQGRFTIQRHPATGAPVQISDGNLVITIEYDHLGRVSHRRHSINQRDIYQLHLTYDNLSRIAQKQETTPTGNTTHAYTYDADGQLIAVQRNGELVEQYHYDANGNRTHWQLGSTTHRASYDHQDRLIELDGTPYKFDADGFLMQRGDTSFQYSATGELLQVTLPQKKIAYHYDSMNRRIARTDETGTEQYLYGNPNHPFQVTAHRDPAGNLHQYHYDDFGLLLALETPNGWYYITTDQLGSPKVLCDAAGELLKQFTHDSFGQRLQDSNPTFPLPIDFAGGIREPHTRLVRFGFRDYDAVAGKWTAKDPIGFIGSDVNLYRYVGNNSIGFIDPSGLVENPVIEVIAQTGGPCCGPAHDCWQKSDGKCPGSNASQNEVCIYHDYLFHQLAIKTGDPNIWQKAYNSDVIAIQEWGCKNSTNLGVKIGLCIQANIGRQQQQELEKQRQELEKQRIQKYWEEHPEEWQQSTSGSGVYLVP